MVQLPDSAWLHVDSTCCVLNKPAGLPSVPGKGELALDSMAQQVQRRCPDALIVHRLDMSTSGLILMARGPHWQRAYSRLFAQHCVQKHYVAIVHGCLQSDAGSVDLPLIADWPNRPKQKVDQALGKPSLTHFSVISRDHSRQTTRVNLHPVTGRSHQLRVHMLAIGHPVVGDRLYAPVTQQNDATRLLLHSQELALTHPQSAQPLLWRAPADF
jgi:tRNA pseudouridine32 synthase / 23S rRNA pseudouridine746 synthase